MPLNLSRIRTLIGDRTITEVAHAAGMTDGNLHRFLRPGGNPTLNAIERLANALKVRAVDLIK